MKQDDPLDDFDRDGFGANHDNCPDRANPDQANLDGDELGDLCDPDIDGDTVPNDDDCAPTDPERWTERVFYSDTDEDGVGDRLDDTARLCAEDAPQGYAEHAPDNCPEQINPEQTDADGDTIGDACDACPQQPGQASDDGCPTPDDTVADEPPDRQMPEMPADTSLDSPPDVHGTDRELDSCGCAATQSSPRGHELFAVIVALAIPAWRRRRRLSERASASADGPVQPPG